MRTTRDAQPGLRLLRVEFDLEGQHAFLGAAADGQHAMRRNLRRRLAVAGVHLELAFRVRHAFDGAAGDAAVGHHHGAHRLAELGILADPFGDDVARAFERLFRRHAELRRDLPRAAWRRLWSQRNSASGSRPLSRAIEALVRRFGL